MKTYKVNAGMVFVAGKTVCSMPERFKVVCICKALYKYSAFLYTHTERQRDRQTNKTDQRLMA